jgi:prevent-host-death family protein
MAIYKVYYMDMKIANIAELKNKLSEYLAFVEQGEEIEIRKRNVPIARVVPIKPKPRNKTRLGCGIGAGVIHGDLTGPLVPESAWNMLKPDWDPFKDTNQ